jgi:hypothetical protein
MFMSESFATAAPETTTATPTNVLPVRSNDVEVDQSQLAGQRVMRSIGGGSPAVVPEKFTKISGELCRQMQRGYGNQYMGQVIQAKLTIGQPGDVYEQEADRVADAVAKMGEPIVSGVSTNINSIQPLRIQGMCKGCENEKEEKIHPKESFGQTPTVTPGLEDRLDKTRGGGEPLKQSARSYMEPRFGADFSNVRVHAGTEADALNQEIGAQAFTRQRDIYFGAGKYNPETRDGQRLLAHELTHVVQQSGTDKKSVGQNTENLNLSNISVISQPVQRSQATGILQRQSSDARMPANESYTAQVNCLVLQGLAPGGGMRSAGIITHEELTKGNQDCREKTGYKGDDIVPNEDENRQVLTGELVKPELVDELENCYVETLHQVDVKNLDTEQLAALNDALLWLLMLDRKPAQTHFSGLMEPSKTTDDNSNSRSISLSVGLTATMPLIERALVGAGALAAEGSAVAGGVLAGGGAVIGGSLILAAAAFGISYGIYKLLRYAHQDKQVYPDVLEQIKRTIEGVIKARSPQLQPIPIPSPDPTPSPETTSKPLPLSPSIPDPDQRRRRKCLYPTGLDENDPLYIMWFKPVDDSFYPRYIDIMDGQLDRHDPETTLPDGTPVGVNQEYWPSIGKIVRLTPQPRKGKQQEYKEDLAQWGYDWKKEKTEPDHIQDLQWDGPDAYGNLWPYEASTNRSAGSSQNNQQKISFCLTKDGPKYEERAIGKVKKMLYGRYFKIIGFRRHS